ncbi:GDP/GTP exchange factor for ARF, partial [Coemansia sp. RSA 2711]
PRSTPFVPLSAESWRLLVEAEIDTLVRELRKNALWAEAVERDGLGALWVGGSRWPGTQDAGQDAEATEAIAQADSNSPGHRALTQIDRYRREFASRRTLGRAGECIGLASFADRNDDSDGDEMGRVMILESFLLLREAINGVSDPHLMDLQAIIDPFLLVIRDAETTGPITRCALVSIQRFISHGIVDLSRIEAVPALLEMTQAVTHCRFEATDAASDEAVLMQILNVLGALVLSPGGSRLNDVSVCEIMETVLSMSCQMRLSEMLRKAAESTLFTLVTFVFGKLNDMHEGGSALLERDDAPAVAISTDKQQPGQSGSSTEPKQGDDNTEHSPQPAAPVVSLGAPQSVEPAASVAPPEPQQCFGLPAIRELYRVLVALTNPQDLQYTDTMRLLALNTLQAAFQKACYAMAAFAALRELTLGDLSHSLLLILQRDQSSLISPALRVLYLLFASHRRDTKGHLELFLCQTLGRVMALPELARPGSRSPLRRGPATPTTGAQRVLPKPRVVPEISGPDSGLRINDKTDTGSSRRGSAASMHDDAAIPALLAADTAPTYEQEVELYDSASLKKGMRGRLATQETRRQLLEGLHHLLIGDEALLTDLWVNYDCDVQRGNMFDFLVSFVAARAVPWPDARNDESEAYLDIMLHHLIRMAVRAGAAPPTGQWARLLGVSHVVTRSDSADAPATTPLTMAQLLDRKQHKDTMMRAARLFNEKPKDGIAYLQRANVLSRDNSTEMAQQLASFLRETPTINKRLLGEYLSKPSNLEVLQAYLGLFDFSGRRLDEAMRSLLGTFRLPGESQQIERIMETFSAVYFASDPPDIASKDAAFILAYAIIMLNTDQHSPQVKGRMKFEDFARNLRGVNDGHDFRAGFLTDVYNAIRDHELVFPAEHEGAAGFEYAWHAVAADNASPWMSTSGQTGEFDRGLLAATWPRFLQSLARTLAHFSSDHTLRLALSGLHALVASAAHFGLSACVNEALLLLASMTGLHSVSSDMLISQVLVKSYNRYSVLDAESPTSSLGVAAEGFAGSEQRLKLQEQEDVSVQVTQAALQFGQDYRGQVAFVALFELAAQFSSAIGRQGWDALLDVVHVAVDADLLPRQLRTIEDPIFEHMWVPRTSTLLAMDAAQLRIRARRLGAGEGQRDGQQGGLLSAISSFWGSSAESQTSPTRRQELRWRAAPEQLVGLISRGQMAVRASAIGSLSSLGDDIGSALPLFLTVLAERFPQPPPSQPGSPADAADDARSPVTKPASIDSAVDATQAHYVPSSVYLFELAVQLVLAEPTRASTVWPAIEPAVQRMLESADTLHHFALERCVSGLLNMAARVLETDQLELVERMLRCLGLLRDSDERTFHGVAPTLAEGIGRLADTDLQALLAANWAIVRLLLKRLAHVPDFAEAHVGTSNCMRRILHVLVEVVVLLKCGAIDVPTYFADVLDTLAAFVPNDRALSALAASSHMAGSEIASKLIALLYDMQELARLQSGDSAPHSPPHSPHAQTEPSIASVASGLPRHSKTTPMMMWIGAMSALSGFVCLGNREVRQLACSQVQKAISGLAGVSWVSGAFGRVLFPLMDTLLRADLLADSSMEDTHARCISMLTMVFLHNAGALHAAPAGTGSYLGSPSLGSRLGPTYPQLDGDKPEPASDSPLSYIWLRLIAILSVYIHTGKLASSRLDPQSPDAVGKHGASLGNKQAAERRRHLSVLGEMAEESLKNCLLVLDSMEIFGDSTERQDSVLWRGTWEQLDKISPQLKQQVFPQLADNPTEGADNPTEATDNSTEATGNPAEVSDTLETRPAVVETREVEQQQQQEKQPGVVEAETEAGSAAEHGSHDVEKPEPLQEPKKKHGRQNIIIVP